MPMIVFWRIRYLDRSDKKFKDRDLLLDTDALHPAAKAAIELLMETGNHKTERSILKHRGLFRQVTSDEFHEAMNHAKCFKGVTLTEYVEDENEIELSSTEIGQILTGNPNAVSVPSGAEKHDIDLMLAEPKPIPIAEVVLSQANLKLLGYFVRDFRELSSSSFLKEGPGTITARGSMSSPVNDPELTTAVNDDEIRSFVTIFRRLYMENEPANFLKAAAAFALAVGDHPYSRWIDGNAKSFKSNLDKPAEVRPFLSTGQPTFTRKLLIDVFLYTQYAHQPDERRQRQFHECLSQVDGKRSFLAWLFLTEMWKISLEICNAGRLIAAWLDRYCEHHQVCPDVITSLRCDHPGIGANEKDGDRRARLFREKSEELALEMWKTNGRPAGGPMVFQREAERQLKSVLEDDPT